MNELIMKIARVLMVNATTMEMRVTLGYLAQNAIKA